MTGNKRSMSQDWSDPDEAPDLSSSLLQEKLAVIPAKQDTHQ